MTRGSKTVGRLSNDKSRELEIELRGLLGDGLSDVQCLARMDVTQATFERIKRNIMEAEESKYRGADAYTSYVRYSLIQQSVVEDLDFVRDSVKGALSSEKITGNLAAALVTAAKTKSQITAQLFETGRKMNVIRREVEEEIVIDGVPLSQISSEQLGEEYKKNQKSLMSMFKRYSGADYRREQERNIYQSDSSANDYVPEAKKKL